MRASSAALLLSLLAACGQATHDHHGHPRDERAHLADGVVARIGDAPVTGSEVRSEMLAAGGTPRDALDRVIAARLLAREATKQGYARRADVLATVDRVAVQELLARRIEDELPESAVTDAEVAAAYTAAGTRFVVPDQRASVHVLVSIPRDAPEARSDAARALAEQARQELLRASDLQTVSEVLDRWNARQGGPFEVKAERVPATAPDGPLVTEYLHALFAIDATHVPSVASALVRTEFGWHAIVLTEVVPGRVTPLAEVAPALRTEVNARRRRARLDALLTELVQRTPPIADPDGMRHALAETP